MSTTAKSLQQRPFLYNCLNPSSTHLSSRTSRCPSGVRSANSAIIASLTSSCGSSIRGCSGSACPFRKTPMASRPSTIPMSTEPLPNGPMMGRSSRRSSPVWAISQTRRNSTSACSMATGPTPWPKKGRWDWLLGLQASEGREDHRHDRQPWLCVVSASPSRQSMRQIWCCCRRV